MDLVIKYLPDIGFAINNVEFKWGMKKEIARRLLNNEHEIARFQNRDIYKNYLTEGTFFFLNYSEQNLLIELEVHQGVRVIVSNVLLTFERDLEDIKNDLERISGNVIKTGDGEYFFKDLKLTISDSEAMGGNDHLLGYFYCASDTSHLD